MSASTTTKSSVAQRRARLRSARREAILAAARRVFARKGFEGTTIADVAREAGVATGTVYLYYASKIDLFAALNAHLYELIGEALEQAEAPPDLRGGTHARVAAVFETARRHRDLLRLVFLNPDPRTEAARRMQQDDERRMRPLVDLLRTGMRYGTVRQGDPCLMARLINGLVGVALYQCFVQGEGRDIPGYVEFVTDMIVGGLEPK